MRPMTRDESVVLAGKSVRFLERFWAKVEKTDKCWLWKRALQTSGYGFVRVPGAGMMLAHRVSWILAHGPIPPGHGAHGICVLHNCPDGDNPRCVNPAHLFLGDHDANMADRQAKGRVVRGARHGRATLSPSMVREIRTSNESLRAVAARLRISYSVAQAVRDGKTYRDVT